MNTSPSTYQLLAVATSSANLHASQPHRQKSQRPRDERGGSSRRHKALSAANTQTLQRTVTSNQPRTPPEQSAWTPASQHSLPNKASKAQPNVIQPIIPSSQHHLQIHRVIHHLYRIHPPDVITNFTCSPGEGRHSDSCWPLPKPKAIAAASSRSGRARGNELKWATLLIWVWLMQV